METLKVSAMWVRRLAFVEKIVGLVFVAVGLWFFADSTLEITGPDLHGYRLFIGSLCAILAGGFLVAGFTCRTENRLSWLGQLTVVAAILFVVWFLP